MNYILQALKGKNDWWRVFIVCFPFVFLFGISFLIFILFPDITTNTEISGDKNLDLALMLSQFGFLLVIFIALFYLLHRRSIVTLTTARPRIDFKRILFSFSLVIVLQVLFFAISYNIDNTGIEWNLDTKKFAVLFIVGLLFFPVQIGFEEYFFRGYLMQQIGISTKSVWIPLIFTSVFFGLVHGANPEVSQIGMKMMFFYIGTGFFLGLITILDDGLELALGFHFANNFIAATLITSDFSALQTDAVFRYTGEFSNEEMFNETMISMLIMYPLFLIIFGFIYKWKWRLKYKNSDNI